MRQHTSDFKSSFASLNLFSSLRFPAGKSLSNFIQLPLCAHSTAYPSFDTCNFFSFFFSHVITSFVLSSISCQSSSSTNVFLFSFFVTCLINYVFVGFCYFGQIFKCSNACSSDSVLFFLLPYFNLPFVSPLIKLMPDHD